MNLIGEFLKRCIYCVKHSLVEATSLFKLALKAYSGVWSRDRLLCFSLMQYLSLHTKMHVRCWLTLKYPQERGCFGSRRNEAIALGHCLNLDLAPRENLLPLALESMQSWQPEHTAVHRNEPFVFLGQCENLVRTWAGGVELSPRLCCPSFTTSAILHRGVWWQETGDEGQGLKLAATSLGWSTAFPWEFSALWSESVNQYAVKINSSSSLSSSSRSESCWASLWIFHGLSNCDQVKVTLKEENSHRLKATEDLTPSWVKSVHGLGHFPGQGLARIF